jgi:hypothetical protein
VRGGILLVAKESANTGYILNISDSSFSHNTAEQGGVVFFEDLLPLNLIRNCVFIENSALRYGSTFASVGVQSTFIKKLGDHVIESGSNLPPYSAAVVDYFWDIVKPFSISSDFVYFQSFLCTVAPQPERCNVVFKGSDSP